MGGDELRCAITDQSARIWSYGSDLSALSPAFDIADRYSSEFGEYCRIDDAVGSAAIRYRPTFHVKRVRDSSSRDSHASRALDQISSGPKRNS
jgi:hypothetical protein